MNGTRREEMTFIFPRKYIGSHQSDVNDDLIFIVKYLKSHEWDIRDDFNISSEIFK